MRSYLAPCLDFLFDAPHRPAITLDLDELDSSIQRQLGQGQEAERFERLEAYYIPRVDHLYTASEKEAQLVRREHGVDRVSVIPNAVQFPTITGTVEEQYDLLFVGNLSYEPNIDAVRWLCEEIRPLLGAVEIAIVGSRPGPEVRALAELAGVTVVGDAPEVTPWYRRSRVAVVPLRIGGGSPTKTVEALAHGRPVVATSLGATGACSGQQRGVLTADSADAFAYACRRLLCDSSAAARLGAAGRANVVMAERVAEQIDLATCARLNGASASAS
jgi:glycosyltransferase involved in cell wall biosynthesis